MASTCSTCLEQNKTSVPMIWCQLCDAVLCQPCSDNHRQSESTKDHVVIPYEDYLKLPPYVTKTKFLCAVHHEKYSHFCPIHDAPTCKTCLKEFHEQCEEIREIEDVVQNVKNSVAYENIFPEIEDMCRILKEIAENRETNEKQLEGYLRDIKERLEEKYEQVMNHLKQIKENTFSKIDMVYNEAIGNLSSTIQQLRSKEKELRDFLNQKDEISKFASDYQTFIGIKNMEKTVYETNANLQEMNDNEKLERVYIKFDTHDTIKYFHEDVLSLGDFRVIKCPSDVTLSSTRKPAEAAQINLRTQRCVKLNFQGDIELEKFHYCYGVCTLPNGLIVLTDSGDDYDEGCKVCTYNTDGSLKSTINFKETEGAFDVTPIDDHHVAASHPYSKNISIINVEEGKVVRSIDTGEEIRGLCCRGRDLVCCVNEKGLVRVNLDSEEVDTVVRDENVIEYSHVEARNDLLCYTTPRQTYAVYVLDSRYNSVCTFEDETLLKFPMGLAMDEDSNIFVTGGKSNNVVAISPDGKSSYQMLGEARDALDGPSAIHYESTTKKLLVVNELGPAFVYSVM